MPLRLLALTLCVFCIGTAELLPGGVLPELADAFGVSISTAGLLVTVYAATMMIGGPLVSGLTRKVPAKTLLIALMAVFVAGSAVAATAPSYGVLVTARIICALTHGTFVAVSIVVAAGMVPPQRTAAAVSTIVLGYNLATVLGVPLGTLVGQQWGWRATFWAVTALSVAGAAVICLLLPAVRAEETGSLRGELRAFRAAGVLMSIVITVLATGGMFTLITYMVPVLKDVSGFSAGAIPVLLVAYGVGSLLGNMVSGRVPADRLLPALIACLAVLTGVCLLFWWVSPHPVAAAVGLFVFAFVTFVAAPGLQTYTLTEASDAPTFSVTVSMSAFGLGAVIGSWYGGRVIDSGLGMRSVAPAAGALVAVAAAVALAWHLKVRAGSAPAPADAPASAEPAEPVTALR
ncbi:MFS transporter [Streptomyces sp. NPDC059070]|uniref:MFS transporter n=1 Tax=Streptomyces sp. NPDC059070 TaxID=3346713 RepID=UPI0036C7C635